MYPATHLGPNVVSMRAYQVQREIAHVEHWAQARSGQDRLRLGGMLDELGVAPGVAAPPGTPHDQIPLVNRLLGPAICRSMSCEESPITYADGTQGTMRGSCETFWRIDRPRTYVALGLIALAGYGVYRKVRK